MAAWAEIAGHLQSFGVADCHVRSREIIAFTAQKWTVDDALEPRDTLLVFYYPLDPADEQWAVRELDQMTGIHGCACFQPQERSVFVADPGEVYVVGQGDDDYEKSIATSGVQHFNAVKCIAGGYAYAAGIGRKVYQRTAAAHWTLLTDATLTGTLPGDLDHAGFQDIDGFADNDLYACGGLGDLWHYDGKRWTREDIPTNAPLGKILCAPDGKVYITTGQRQLLIGRRGTWRVHKADIGKEMLAQIVEFDGRVWVSTDQAIYEVRGQDVVPAALGQPKMSLCTHLASGDGVLVVAGAHEAYLYDGSAWKTIFRF